MRQWAQGPIAAGFLLALAVVGLHHGATTAGFGYDDPIHLQFALRYSPIEYFTDVAVMRWQSYAHLTPWNALFFDIGLMLGGLDARIHHAHLLAVVWACAFATWGLLRRWLKPPAAMIAALVFLAMPTTGVIASVLMTGHYAYGLLFSILSLHAHARALERGEPVWAVASAGCYAMACLCKELYVPLVAVLLAMPLGERAWRLRAAIPPLAVALGYAALRLHVLGGPGGYAAMNVEGGPMRAGPAAVTQRVAEATHLHVFGEGQWGVAAGLMTVVILALAVRAGKRVPALLLAAAVAALLAPAVPVFTIEPPGGAGRLLLAIGWAVAAAVGWASSGVRPAWAIAAVLCLALAAGQRVGVERTLNAQRIAAQQYEFLAKADPGEILVPHRFEGNGYLLAFADAAMRARDRPAALIVDDEDEMKALGPDRGARAWAWNEVARRLERLGPRYELEVARHRAARAAAEGRPLEGRVAMRVQGKMRVMQWEVVSEPGTAFLHVERYARLEIPPRGSAAFGLDATLALPDPVRLRFLVQPADGALIRSLPLSVSISHDNSAALHVDTSGGHDHGRPGSTGDASSSGAPP